MAKTQKEKDLAKLERLYSKWHEWVGCNVGDSGTMRWLDKLLKDIVEQELLVEQFCDE